MNEEPLIDCWDLDDTILDKQKLFVPIIRRCSEVANITKLRASESLTAVAKTGLHFQDWFAHMGIDSSLWSELEAELRDDILSRGSSCIYPGVIELLRNRSLGARQILVTVGDPEFQKLKFDSLGLGHIFLEEDRHYILRDGSKAAIVERYAADGRVTFIDDREEWLREVSSRCPSVRCVRSGWSAATKESSPDLHDAVLHTSTIEELAAVL